MNSLRDEFHFLVSGRGGKYYIAAILVPVVVVLVFCAIFVNNQINEGKVLIIDLDNTPYSQQVIEKLDASQYISVEGVLNQPAEPEEILYHEEYLGIVYLPQELEVNHYKALPNNIGLFLDNTNLSATSNLRTAVQEVITAENMSVSIPRVKTLGVSDDQAAGIINNITVQQRVLFNPNGTYVNTMVMGFMNLYTAIFFCFAVLPILPRLRVMNRFEGEILGSSALGVATRVLPYAILVSIGLFFGLGLLKVFGGFRFSGNPLVFLIPTFLYGLTLGLKAMLASWGAKNPGAAMGRMMFIVVPGFLFSGVTISPAILPKWAVLISNAFPMVWFMKFIRSIGLRGAPMSSMLGELGGFITLFGVVLLLVVIRYHVEKHQLLKKKAEGAGQATSTMPPKPVMEGH